MKKNPTFIVIWCTAILFILSTHNGNAMTFEPHHKQIAFVTYHAGETKALLPAMRALIHARYQVSIIPMGQTAAAILAEQQDLHEKTHIPEGLRHLRYGENSQFAKVLTESDIKEFVALTKQADFVVIGTPAKGQLQLAKRIHELGHTKIITYYDGFFYSDRLDAFAILSDAVFVSTHQIAALVREKSDELKRHVMIKAIGHGDVDAWRLLSEHLNKEDIKHKMNIEDQNLPVIVWGGGYGATEKLSFPIFAKVMYEINKIHPCYFRVAPHPGAVRDQKNFSQLYIEPLLAAGFTEKEVNTIIVPPQKVTTGQAALVADAFYAYSSTTVFQATALGIRASFFQPDILPNSKVTYEAITILHNANDLKSHLKHLGKALANAKPALLCPKSSAQAFISALNEYQQSR